MPPRYLGGIMYINELHIEKYKVLEDIHINFQVPKDNQNALNILAGPNGCGKTSLLELLIDCFGYNKFVKNNIGLIYNADRIDGKIDQNKGIPIYDATYQFYRNMRKGSFYFQLFHDCEKYAIHKSTDNAFIIIENHPDFSDITDLENFFVISVEFENRKYNNPQIIYLPNRPASKYEFINKIDRFYQFRMVINHDNALGISEFYIKEYIITKERQSTKSDPKERAKDAVDLFNAIFQNSDFVTKLVDLDPFQNNRPIFETINHERITIEQLSDGEKQLYGRVISLLMLNPHNSLILIDEPEIGLHPKWQYTIMDIYKNIGQNNQFIIATHSPHILAKAHYKELILLKKKDNKIVAEQFDKPPTSRDINSVLGGIMEAKYLPDDITEWHRQYRDLVEKGKKDSPEAQELRIKILEYEPEESEFMQSIRFYEALNS